MKPNRPHVVTSTRNDITVGWDACDCLILGEPTGVSEENRVNDQDDEYQVSNNPRWYLLEKKDRVFGWVRAYVGFKTEAKVGPMAPGDYYEFRLKVKTPRLESEWSDTLYALTKDDVIPVTQLHRAVENGPVTSLRKILSQRLSAIDVPNRYGQTSLKLAVAKNNVNFMGILLNHGADMESPEVGSRRTPLMMAAAKGHLEAVQLLLEKGSSWDLTDRNGCTAFNYAVENSHLPIVRLAVEGGVDLSAKDKFGWSALMRGIVLKSSLKVLSYLLESGMDPDECDDRQQTVLMQAVLSGRPEVVELLIEHGANIKRRNLNGHSACDMAKNSFDEAMVKMASLWDGDDVEDSTKKTN